MSAADLERRAAAAMREDWSAESPSHEATFYLAVAEWLEREAEVDDQMRTVMGKVFRHGDVRPNKHAIAVSSAYLGGTE